MAVASATLRRVRLLVTFLGVLVVAACASAGNDTADEATGAAFRPRAVVSGLSDPVFVGAPADERNRLYIVEQTGRIVVVDRGRRRSAPFLDIADEVLDGGEQGLLGLAFHPQYGENKRFYVQFTDNGGDTRLVEYRSNGTKAIPGSARLLFRSDDPYGNHNGGMLAFAPNGGSISRWATAARVAIPRTAPRTGARSSASCCRSTSTRGG